MLGADEDGGGVPSEVTIVRAEDGSVGLRFLRPNAAASGPFEVAPCRLLPEERRGSGADSFGRAGDGRGPKQPGREKWRGQEGGPAVRG